MIRKILEVSHDINAVNNHAMTYFHWAFERRHSDVATILIGNGMDDSLFSAQKMQRPELSTSLYIRTRCSNSIFVQCTNALFIVLANVSIHRNERLYDLLFRIAPMLPLGILALFVLSLSSRSTMSCLRTTTSSFPDILRVGKDQGELDGLVKEPNRSIQGVE